MNNTIITFAILCVLIGYIVAMAFLVNMWIEGGSWIFPAIALLMFAALATAIIGAVGSLSKGD